jgi:hypothetical protein
MDQHWCRTLARQIAAALFENGNGQKAVRLILELPDKRDGVGWCEKPVADLIETMLVDKLAIKSAGKPKTNPARPAAPRPARRTGRSG